MLGLYILDQQQKLPQGRHGLWVLLLGLLLLLLPLASPACTLSNAAGDNENGMMIHITGHSIQGQYLIITYDIEFPGMTKVKLFNGNNELLWRNQYVDDKEGAHRLVLKASVLNPGNYVFEFDYKNQKQNYALSM
jgi:hypothetical protein